MCCFVKTRVIVRDEIDQPLGYPGVSFPITISTVKNLSLRTDRSIQQRKPRSDCSSVTGLTGVLNSCHSICALFYGRTGSCVGLNSMANAGCAYSVCGMGVSIFWAYFWFLLSSIYLFLSSFFSFSFFLFLGDGLILDVVFAYSKLCVFAYCQLCVFAYSHLCPC